MNKILILKSSIMGNNSQTNTLIDTDLTERQLKGLHDEVEIRDLAKLNLRVLNNELFNSMRGASDFSEKAFNAVALSDKLIAELKGSDIVVIGAPMYNLNVPTQLKNWFDLVTRAGVTFKYTETYPMGLVEGVCAVVVSSRGGIHLGQETDAATPYLKSVLGLIGVTDVEFIYAEGMDIKPDGQKQGIANAKIASLIA
uniref:FMN dependent NADH:quinone oxidoreductase n=1 Tax=Arsenophonus endosymbiont of Trialeurodes vaporariorum TaxID=235567 RepID=A0A3B0MLR6_9GAMM